MNFIICQICKLKYKGYIGLTTHIRKKHKITKQFYYDQYFRTSLDEGKCYCGKNTTFSNITSGYAKHCSVKCTQLDPLIKKKKIDTNLLNRGVENPFQDKEIKNQIKQTHIKNRNCDNPMKDPKVKEKGIETNRRKFNYDNAMKNPEILKKQKDTMIKNYGVEYPLQCKEFLEKAHQTYEDLTGYNFPMQNPEVQEKYKQTCLKNLGAEHPYQSEKIIKKGKLTSIKNCGYDSWTQSPKGKIFLRISAVKRVETQELNGEPLMPCIGPKERECLNILEPYTPQKKIIRNNHDYVYRIGRFPDGDVDRTIVFIQYNEKEHYLDKETMKIENEDTIQTTLDLASAGHIVFNISEYDWKNNKDQVINQFQILLDNINAN